MEKFKVIDANSALWKSEIERIGNYDFYQTSFYHNIDNNDESKLLFFEKDENFLAFPIVIRRIFNSPYFDITSVYGYAGPIFNIKEECLVDFTSFFKNTFKQYCINNKIVSAFSRLHPLLNQTFLFDGMGEILELNKTVSIDLTLNIDQQRSEYRKSLKSDINQLRRKGYNIISSKESLHVDKFIDIYHQTMDRVAASPRYYFSKEYFYAFLNNSDFESILLLAEKESQITAGAIFTLTNDIMQYHLAGTLSEFMQDTPMKLILEEARLIGNAIEFKNLHLGGGVGGSDDDSLFRFKSGFSKNFNQFSVWRYVVNKDVYEQLVFENGQKDNKSDFFPLYRA